MHVMYVMYMHMYAVYMYTYTYADIPRPFPRMASRPRRRGLGVADDLQEGARHARGAEDDPPGGEVDARRQRGGARQHLDDACGGWGVPLGRGQRRWWVVLGQLERHPS